MFRKYYKAANDEIETNRELIDKIFDKYTETEIKKNRGKVYTFGMRYGTAFAAVLVLCIAVAVYPKISNLNEEPTEVKQQAKTDATVTNILPENASQDAADKLIINANTGEVTEVRPNTTEKKKATIENSDLKQSVTEDTGVSMARIADTEEKSQDNPAKVIIDCGADISKLESVTEDEIILATNTLTEKLGTADESTGNVYSFEIAGKFETDEKYYYLGRWRWLVDNHSSLICEFVLSDDLKELYECAIYDNTVNWTTMNNMFE